MSKGADRAIYHTASLATLAAALLWASPSMAQDAAVDDVAQADTAGGLSDKEDASDTNKIVVTAQKRSEDVQDVPITIAVASAETLENASITNVQQLGTIVPSLNVTNVAGAVSFFIRGVGTTSSQVENQVATYVDDVYIANQRTVGQDLMDVQQVAVLKGPQGTLFGRNATGGVVQIVTRDPKFRPEFEVETGIDNYGTWRSDFFAGGALNDSVRASLTGSYTTQADGWGHNPIADYDTFKIDNSVFLRGKVLADISDRVSFKVAGSYQYSEGTYDIIETPFPGTVLGFEPDVVGTEGNRDSRGEFPNTTSLENVTVSGDLRIDLGVAEFRSISGYSSGSHDWQFDADRTPTPAFNIYDYETFDNFSQELQLVSNSGGPLEWAVGAFYFHNVNENNPIVYDFMGPFAPDPDSLALDTIYGSESADSYAGYAQGTLEILPRTNLTVGARYTWEKRRIVADENGVLNDGTDVSIASVDKSVTFDAWTYRIGLDHQIDDRILLYLSFDRGFKAGGFNISTPTNDAFYPETLNAWQGGVKFESVDGNLRFNTGVFYYDYKNIQLKSFTPLKSSQITNAAKAEMYGLEADLTAYVTPDFWLVGNMSLLHANFKDYPNAIISQDLGGGFFALEPGDATGNRLPFAQPFQLSVALNYDLETRFGDILFNITNSYNSAFYYEPDNALRQPAYDYLNLSAKWTDPSDTYDVRVWVSNLLDEDVGATVSTQTIGQFVSYNNPPRRFGITLGARF